MNKNTSFFHIPFRLTQYLYNHKGLITICLFAIYMVFFDKFNMINQVKIYSKLVELKDRKEDYQNMIKQAIADKQDLESNFEKFAREKYQMSRKDEEVYIIEKREKR